MKKAQTPQETKTEPQPTDSLADKDPSAAKPPDPSLVDQNGEGKRVNQEVGQSFCLHPMALEGLAGQFVRAVEPNTEADPAALLFSFLAALACSIGRSAYVQMGNLRQHANLFVVMVGRTASGAKGTSWQEVLEVFRRADPKWTSENIVTGLSTREGMVKVFDTDDPGQKNLLAYEPEFGNVLTNAKREGNTITGALREAFDTDKFQVITRKEPLKVSGAHFCMVAHITPADMSAHWRARDTSNGLGNRMLWVRSERTKILPWPDATPAEVLLPIVSQLTDAINFGRDVGEVKPTPSAIKVYSDAVPELVEEVDGLVGDLLTRARVLVLRLALVYAILDRSEVIDARHVLSALAAWEYCKASAMWAFGLAGLSADAEMLQSILKRSGGQQTRTQLIRSTNGHLDRIRMGRAAEELQRAGLAEERKEPAKRASVARPGGAPRRILRLIDTPTHGERCEECEECSAGPLEGNQENSQPSQNSQEGGTA